MSLERTVKWIDKTGKISPYEILEGRDKFCKAIQYACRFLKFHYEQKGDKNTSKKLDALFGAMRDARKLFRLFKTVNEYKKIEQLIKKTPQLNFANVLAILTRAFFGVYWIYDNLNILSKIKVIEKDPKPFAKTGAFFWLLALLTNLIAVVREIILNEKKMEHLKRSYLAMESEKEFQDKKKQYLAAEKKRFTLGLNLIKVLGDIIPAGQGSQTFQTLFGWTANDKLCGLGGFVSALITSYQLYD